LKIIKKWLIRVRRDTSPNAGANLVADRSGGVSPSRHHGNSQRAKKIIWGKKSNLIFINK